jgi:plasmid maintenance system antidote protein VapI
VKELSKDSKFSVSIETLVILGSVLVTVVGMWFTLQSEIDEAKKLPPAEVSRTEYDLKDQLIRETIINIEDKVDANGVKLDKIEERLYRMQ